MWIIRHLDPRGKLRKDKEFSTLRQPPWRTPTPGYPETGVIQLQLQLLLDHHCPIRTRRLLRLAVRGGVPDTSSYSYTKISA